MSSHNNIQVFEHETLKLNTNGFTDHHLNLLLKLNDAHGGVYFQPVYKGIKFNQYVGVLQVKGLTIEINPKADKYDTNDKWKNVLIPMLKACGKLNVKNSGKAQLKRQKVNLLEIYFENYLQEINMLLNQGFIKQYRNHTANINTLKGKLEFAANIRKNLVRKDRFYTTHQVYDQNHLLHQILYKALNIIGGFTQGTYLYDAVQRIEIQFPKLSAKNITVKDLDSIKLTRKSFAYKEALDLAELIILNYSPDLSGGKQNMIAFLFDMNNLWETFVLKQLQKYTKGKENMSVYGQESRSFIGNHTLRPDIRICINNEDYIVDTKWKIPYDAKASVQDLRQMYTYGRYWNAKKIMLLYPGAEEKSKVYRNFVNRTDYSEPETFHQCKVGFASVITKNNMTRLNTNLALNIIELLENSHLRK
ncbi:McrC family protein [Wenyingzhuangia sp. IMCC45533]